jgi:hypothetical protein
MGAINQTCEGWRPRPDFGEMTVPKSVLDAIKMGYWNFEPARIDQTQFDSTPAMPGTKEKVSILADRAQKGLPLWHDSDRIAYDDLPSE